MVNTMYLTLYNMKRRDRFLFQRLHKPFSQEVFYGIIIKISYLIAPSKQIFPRFSLLGGGVAVFQEFVLVVGEGICRLPSAN